MNAEILRDALLACLRRPLKARPVMSRQARWQDRQSKRGACRTCGDPTDIFRTYCNFHARAARQRNRKYNGCKVWQPGSRGRPPLDAETP